MESDRQLINRYGTGRGAPTNDLVELLSVVEDQGVDLRVCGLQCNPLGLKAGQVMAQ